MQPQLRLCGGQQLSKKRPCALTNCFLLRYDFHRVADDEPVAHAAGTGQRCQCVICSDAVAVLYERVRERLALGISRSEKAKQIRFGDSLVDIVRVRRGEGAFGDATETEHHVWGRNSPDPVERRKHHFQN